MAYEYIVEEQSVDVRTFKIVSEKELTEDEIYEYYPVAEFKEGVVYTADFNPKVSVQFEGTEYGDDSQITITRINE